MSYDGCNNNQLLVQQYPLQSQMMGCSDVHEKQFVQDIWVHKKHSEDMVTRHLGVSTPPQEEPCYSPVGSYDAINHRQLEKLNANTPYKAFKPFKPKAKYRERFSKMMDSSKDSCQIKQPTSLPNEQSLRHETEEKDFGVPTPPQEEPCFSPDESNDAINHHRIEKLNANSPFKIFKPFKPKAKFRERFLKMMESSKDACQMKQPTSLPNEQSLRDETEEKDFGVPTPPQEEPCFSPDGPKSQNYRLSEKFNSSNLLKYYANDSMKLNVVADEVSFKYREEMRLTSLPNVQSKTVSEKTERKDAAYRDKTKRKNKALMKKRSREKRKLKSDELWIRTAYLEEENLQLRSFIDAKHREHRHVLQNLIMPNQQVQ